MKYFLVTKLKKEKRRNKFAVWESNPAFSVVATSRAPHGAATREFGQNNVEIGCGVYFLIS